MILQWTLLFPRVHSSLLLLQRSPANEPSQSFVALLARLIMLIIAAMVAYALFLLVRAPDARRISSPMRTPTPLDILKGRYARREITRQQFWEMKNDLES